MFLNKEIKAIFTVKGADMANGVLFYLLCKNEVTEYDNKIVLWNKYTKL